MSHTSSTPAGTTTRSAPGDAGTTARSAPGEGTATRSARDAGTPAGDPDTLLETLAAATTEDERRQLVEAVVGATLPLADSLAARYAGRGIDPEDLVQVARTALVAAIRRYRPGAGRGFVAFAVPTIRGELKRHFRDAGWVVRPPRGLQELRAEVAHAEEDLRHRLGREVAAAEVAETLGRSAAEVAAARACASAFAPGSLDAPSPYGGTTGEHLADPADATAAAEWRAAVRAEVARLTPRERLILRLRFVEERTQGEIGAIVGVSQMQVSRILTSMLDRLREGLDPARAA